MRADVGAEKGRCAVRLDNEALRITQVRELVLSALLTRSPTWVMPRSPVDRAVLHIHLLSTNVGAHWPTASIRGRLTEHLSFSAITRERLRVVRADLTPCQWHPWLSYRVPLGLQIDS